MKSVDATHDYLHSSLHSLNATGPNGFEGLIREILENWTGQKLRLARSGSQSGKDASSDSSSDIMIAAEMKRYERDSSLSLRNLLGGFAEVIQSHPDLDLWILAATTEIGDKESEGLKKLAEQAGIEILLLDSRISGSGYLDVFCVKYPDLIKAFLLRNIPNINMEELASAIATIQHHANYERTIQQLNEIFDNTVFGFNSTRGKAFQWLVNRIDTRAESMSTFSQDIGLHDKQRRPPIVRAHLNNQFDSWWNNRKTNSAHVALLGEEGTGKTWAAMAWLVEKFDKDTDPIILPITSAQLSGGTGLDSLIIDMLIKRCGKTDKFWRKRLDGWRRGERTIKPLFLLYLDGLNEKPKFCWNSLISQANASDWDGYVTIFMTSRKDFYKANVAFKALGITEIETKGYDDDELNQELDRAGIKTPDTIPNDLRSLIRRPRYCDLALRYFAPLLDSGDLTIERLLYQDYKDRVQKKLNLPVTDDDFNQMLCNLAKKYMHGHSSFDKAAIRSVLPGADDNDTILQEIIDGGLLVKTDLRSTPYRVEPQRLIYGLGMILADQLAEEAFVSTEEYVNAAQTWLEPQSDMDMKVSIVGAAVFMSIMDKDYPFRARQALLRIWIGARNMTETQERAVTAYLPDCASDIAEVSDIFWSTGYDNGVAQDRLAVSFLKHRDDARVKPLLVNACNRWTSYVNINGHPFDRHSRNANIEELRQDLFKRLGKEVAIGDTIIFHDRKFYITEDDNLLRMARFVLFLVSGGDRLSFIETFIQWAISRRLMGRYSEFEEAAWVLRLADEDLWDAFAPHVTKMAMSQDETLKKAASLLLTCIGNRPANELLKAYLDNLYPKSTLQIEYEKDPYSSIFALPSRDHCEPCMARDDLPVWRIAEKIKKYLDDPDIKAPERFIVRLRETVGSLPVTGYRASFSHSIEDHQIETFIPVLARFAYQNLAELMRQTVHTLDQRNDEGVRQLLIHLPELGIILNESEIATLDKYLAIYHRKACVWPEIRDGGILDREMFAEARGTLARIMHLKADEIAPFILNRPEKAADFESFEDFFLPLPAETIDFYLSQLLTELSPLTICRLLWLLGISRPVLSDAHRSKLIEWMDSADRDIEYCSYKFVWSSGDQNLVNHVLQQSGTLHPETSRTDAWIANIYWKHGRNIPCEKLARRLPLEWVGNIIGNTSCHIDDIRLYANLLDSIWQHIAQNKDIKDILYLTPDVETDQKDGATFVHYHEPSIDRSTRFISLHMSWRSGNSENKNSSPNLSLQESSEEFAERQRLFHEQIESVVSAEGTRWRYCQLNTETMAHVCRAYPHIIDKWVNEFMECPSEQRLLISCSGFYQSLCAALFTIGHPQSIVLWRKIRQQPYPVTFNDSIAGTDWMTCIPFSTMPFLHSINASSELLENCCSDIGLLELATAACAYKQQSWILEKAKDLIAKPQLCCRAKGLMLISLADNMDKEISIIMQSSDLESTWVEKLLPEIKYLHNRNRWAHYWYNRFLTVPDHDEAFACFQLFLKTIDRRCRLWMDELAEGAQQAFGYAERRTRFCSINNDQIRKAIKDNEKELNDHFLTLKFEKGQILPFL